MKTFSQRTPFQLTIFLISIFCISLSSAQAVQPITNIDKRAVAIEDQRFKPWTDYFVKDIRVNRAGTFLDITFHTGNGGSVYKSTTYQLSSSAGGNVKTQLLGKNGDWTMFEIPAGATVLTLTLDPANNVAETREDNNTCSIRIGGSNGVYSKRCISR